MAVLFAQLVMAQGTAKTAETMVVGHVFSKADKTPLEAVNIYFKGTDIGTTTDEDGFYVLKHTGDEHILVFSSIGFKTQEMRVKSGETSGLYVEMKEDVHFLKDVFVLPGKNPALDLMDKVRKHKYQNDIYKQHYQLFIEDQEVVLLAGDKSRSGIIRYFDKAVGGIAGKKDSATVFPLYWSKENSVKDGQIPIQSIAKESKASPENLDLLFERLTTAMGSDMNFYHNTLVVFGKHFISPLSSHGNTFYRYFLIDSLQTEQGKEYYLRYRSKNRKNLAFNGEIWIDSASYAVTKINATMPRQANLNFINNLSISSSFSKTKEEVWLPYSSTLALDMSYQLLADSSNLSPEIYVEKQLRTSLGDEQIDVGIYTETPYTQEELALKMAELNDLPIMRTAKVIADAILTGYLRAGMFDIGKLYQLMRLSEIEGVRMSVPLRTNEHLFKNIELGGYWGYGLRNKEHQYSAYAAWRMPLPKRTVVRGGYTQDLRRVDYDYNDFLLRENPLLSGDEDIAVTLPRLWFTDKINPRKEWSFSLEHDWNHDINSQFILRRNEYFANNALPDIAISQMQHQSFTLATRFSFDEKIFEDHLNKIHIHNQKPAFYIILEGGQAKLSDKDYPYGKIDFRLNHQFSYSMGEWNYRVEAGWILGNLPYNLLWMPHGNESSFFKRYYFNLMDYREFALDKYISMQHEWVFNGLLFNHIPVLRLLNLRESLSLKCLYGGRSAGHTQVLDFPINTGSMQYPYVEVGAGINNIFRIFTLHAVWRLTETNKPNVRTWGLFGGLRINF